MLVGMTRSRTLLTMLGVLTAALAVSTVWLMLHNPSIDGTGRGDDYACLAPYDTVLNGADNVPGGEPPPDADEIASRCRGLGNERFDQGLIVGSASALLAGLTIIVALRRSRD